MFKLQLRGGLYYIDDRFRDVLKAELLIRNEGIIFNIYENSIMNLEDIYSYEDEDGNIISLRDE